AGDLRNPLLLGMPHDPRAQRPGLSRTDRPLDDIDLAIGHHEVADLRPPNQPELGAAVRHQLKRSGMNGIPARSGSFSTILGSTPSLIIFSQCFAISASSCSPSGRTVTRSRRLEISATSFTPSKTAPCSGSGDKSEKCPSR